MADNSQNSFQLHPDDKKRLSSKTWVHRVFLLIPLGLIFSIVVLLWAMFSNDGALSSVGRNFPIAQVEQEEEQLESLPIVEDSSEVDELKAYFSSVSPNWKDEFINKVPQAAADSFNDYVEADDEDKLDEAQDFYVFLNNPGIQETDVQFIAFLNDVRADLEANVGDSLFY